MKRIGVVSDSHGDRGHLQQALMKMEAGGKLDCVIHCGDGGRDAEALTGHIMQTIIVKGNNDGWSCPYDEGKLLPIGKATFFITHGHRFGVKNDLYTLADAAVAKGAQVVCFGHTHIPYCGYLQGVLMVNPGSCAFTSRGAVITVDDRGEITAELI